MKYFLLQKDDKVNNDVICYCNDTKGFDQYDLIEGKVIDNWNSEITFYFDHDQGSVLTDCLTNDLGWLIISSKFKEALINYGINKIQYLPVNIMNVKNNDTIKGYYVANVINVIDALNLRYSKYSVIKLEDEEVYTISKYALSMKQIENFHMFKLYRDEIPLFVSEVFIKEIIEGNNIVGCDFLEVLAVK
jgi:hypothetical protein